MNNKRTLALTVAAVLTASVALAESPSPALALTVAVMPVESAPAASDFEYWRERARLIPAGTRRADVERLLPEYKGTPPHVEAGRLALSNGLTISILSATPALTDYDFRLTLVMGMHEVTTYPVAHNITVSVHYDLLKAGAEGESPDNHLLSPITVELHPMMLPLLIEPLASLPASSGPRLDQPIDLFVAPGQAELFPGSLSPTPLPKFEIDHSGVRFNFPIGYQF